MATKVVTIVGIAS